ncbi:MAG: terpene cyclase/mutase family protein [Planctomycetota bacterium]|jgi:hypothetical protein|nr:terpene cyclase/mutase family protein [Planctomycetota bacterium]
MRPVAWLVVVVLLTGASRTSADDRSEQADSLHTAEITTMVTSAHDFLLKNQNKDGSFSVVRGRSSKNAPVAVTGLAALSLMAAGHLPAHEVMDRGRHGTAVKRAVDWLVDHCQDSGETSGYFYTGNDSVSRMHGQGYALLALTQAAGMYGDDEVQRARLHAAIQRGVDLVERTQGIHGGWWYNPERSANHEGSITVCMIQALRAAKDAGFTVDSGVIDKALKYMEKSQDKSTGKFRYALNDDRTTWALTAAALATLNALGDYGSDKLDLGFDALQRSDPYRGMGGGEAFQWYGSFYAAQCYWAYRDRRLFQQWWPSFVEYCADDQWSDGSFHHGDYGQVYATAMVSLTLQVPFGYLPLFQR